jgi:hypothetical protein
MTSIAHGTAEPRTASLSTGRVAAGVAPRRLARLAAHLMADVRNDDPLVLALRLGIDQLLRNDSPERRRHLMLAAEAIATLRGEHSCALSSADQQLIDLVQAECLSRVGEKDKARSLLLAREADLALPALRAAFDAIVAELMEPAPAPAR